MTPLAVLILAIAPATVQTTDVTPVLGFADARMCKLVPTGEAIAQAMGAARRTGAVGKLIDGRILSTRITDRGRDGDVDRVSEVVLPAGSTLYGLPVASIRVKSYQRAEADSYSSRDIVFNASAARVHAAMAGLGAAVPRAPKYLTIPDPDDIVNGAISIKALGHQTVLTCGWGL